jgi:hypothetical protein
MNRRFFICALFLLLSISKAWSQNSYYISGLGRTIITSDRLSGPILNGDKSTPNKGVGGYLLFDLGNNLTIANDFHVNAIIRLRSPYGAFWGVGTQVLIRQFQISGKIKKNIEFQVGDINVGGMTDYTVNNFETEYHRFESDLFRIRRSILEYENFIFGNNWRLQGAHARGTFNLKEQFGKSFSFYSFAVRTNATNDINIPDRVLVGTRLNYAYNDNFQIGANYVGMVDVKIDNAAINYNNNVLTGNTAINLVNNDVSRLSLIGEAGFSNYHYTKDSNNTLVSFNDYIYDGGLKYKSVPLKLNIVGTYRNVGPNFTSPAAQTRRINVTRTPSLFPEVLNNSVNRNQTLYDRFTDEFLYTRSISPILLPYLPQYNNISPYGRATPNRRGFSGGVSTDTSMKVLYAEVLVDVLSEIIGEGIKDKRQFLGIRGGTTLSIDRMLNWKKLLSLNVGARYERTTRGGQAPINFNSNLMDLGIAAEVWDKVDFLVGTKLLIANGNEYYTTRNEFNQISALTPFSLKLKEYIYSAGIRIRFREGSIFNVAYNVSQYKNSNVSDLNYNISQLFVNFTLRF